jgi:hypothetical protein
MSSLGHYNPQKIYFENLMNFLHLKHGSFYVETLGMLAHPQEDRARS